MLRILRIARLHTNLDIAHYSCAIFRLCKLRMHTVVDIEDGCLTAQQLDERRQDNGDRRWLAHQHMTRERNRRRQHGVVSTVLSHFVWSNFSMCTAWGTWYASIYPIAWINTNIMLMHKNYSVSLGTNHLKNLPLLINTQHYSLFHIRVCRLWRQMPDVCKLNSRSLTVRLTGKVQSS